MIPIRVVALTYASDCGTMLLFQSQEREALEGEIASLKEMLAAGAGQDSADKLQMLSAQLQKRTQRVEMLEGQVCMS